jgi:hypothetical protein
VRTVARRPARRGADDDASSAAGGAQQPRIAPEARAPDTRGAVEVAIIARTAAAVRRARRRRDARPCAADNDVSSVDGHKQNGRTFFLCAAPRAARRPGGPASV